MASIDDADRASLGARPGCDKPLPCLPAERVLRWPSWHPLVAVGRRQGNPQDFGEFFLDLDDRLGLAEFGRQPLGFSLEPLVFGDQGGVGVGLSPTTLGGQSGQRPFGALLPPCTQPGLFTRPSRFVEAGEDEGLTATKMVIGGASTGPRAHRPLSPRPIFRVVAQFKAAASNEDGRERAAAPRRDAMDRAVFSIAWEAASVAGKPVPSPTTA